MMVSFTHQQEAARTAATTPRMTSISLSATDLAELGQVIAVGQAVLQKKSPVVARLKAAMTRMGVPLPVGL
jgi:hypothetical protein